MSRSGYTEELEGGGFNLYRGVVESAIRGKRGQALLRELAYAMDSMPAKRLISDKFTSDGEHCALGVVGAFRGIDMSKLDPSDGDAIGEAFNIATALALEVVYMNDEYWGPLSPEDRWTKMRAWVSRKIKGAPIPFVNVPNGR